MTLSLMFMQMYDFEPKDKKGKVYKMYVFVDPQSLTILTGCDLGKDLKENQLYNCKVELKNNKLKVVAVL